MSWRTRRIFTAVLVVAGLLSIGGEAAAEPIQIKLNKLTFSTTFAAAGDSGAGQAAGRASVELRFDTPVTAAEAARLRDELTAGPLLEPVGAATAPATRTLQSAQASVRTGQGPVPDVERLPCQTNTVRLDDNGVVNLQYTCFLTHASLAWSYRLSGTAAATVVGDVYERGLDWWKNSVWQEKSRNHIVPPDYTLHGTLSPVWNRDIIDYQDVLSWRHNIGPGGTIVVAIAGSVELG